MKAMINRSNYEIYFIDYFDGRLHEKSRKELFAFLKANADLKDEFDRFGNVSIEANPLIAFGGKDQLKKDVITLFNYKTWLAAYVEKDLTDSQIKEFETFLSKNNSIKPELEILKQIRIVPDEKIIFPKKNDLKKKNKIISFSAALKPLAVAAAITALFIISYFIIQNQNRKQKEVAEKPALEIPIEPSIDSTSYEKSKTNDTIINTIESPVTNKTKVPEHKKANNSPINKIIKQELPVAEINKKIKEKNNSADSNKSELKNIPTADDNTNEIKNTPFPNNINKDLINSNHSKELTYKDSLTFKFNLVLANIELNPLLINTPAAREIFSEEELKEFSENRKNTSEIRNNNNSLLDFVEDRVKKISENAEVKVRKENNPFGNVVTYALEVGKNFSISHTRSK